MATHMAPLLPVKHTLLCCYIHVGAQLDTEVTGYSTLYESLVIWSYKEQIDAHKLSYKVFYFNQEFI